MEGFLLQNEFAERDIKITFKMKRGVGRNYAAGTAQTTGTARRLNGYWAGCPLSAGEGH